MADLSGQSIGRYHFIDKLGEGGMATVYKAFDTRLERDVAIKIIRREAFSPEVVERMLVRFEREAKALSKLIHANIVPVIDYGDEGGSPYLVMPLISGGTLKDQLTRKHFTPAEAARFLEPIARALDYAHSRGVLHRDVKPSNILITDSGDPMLSDFGVAKILEEGEGATLTGTGVGIGTPEYMAPEQWLGKAGAASDLYSLGVVFYEMVTGHKPYVADTPVAILLKQANDPLPKPSSFVPNLPEAVERILYKALAKNPEERYADMQEFARALEKLFQEEARTPEPFAAQKETIANLQTLVQPVSTFPDRETTDDLQTRLDVSRAEVKEARTYPPEPVRKVLPVGWFAIAGFLVVASIIGYAVTRHPVATPTIAPAVIATTTFTPTIAAPTAFNSKDPATYTYATSYQPYTLDPALDYETAGGEVLMNVYDTLIWYDKEAPNQYVPNLAVDVPSLENYGISEDGLTYTFKIRQGVRFHDGSELTVEDVAYTFQRGILQGGGSSPQWLFTEALLGASVDDVSQLVDPSGGLIDNPSGLQATNASTLKYICERVTSAIVADPGSDTVKFHLAQPYSPFLSAFLGSWGSIQSKAWDIANGAWDGNCDTWQYYYGKTSEEMNQTAIGASPMGTGPFIFDHWTPNEEIVLRANENYWRTEPAWTGGPAGAPAIKAVVIKYIDDFATRLAMAQAGDADGVSFDSTDDYPQLDALVGETCHYPDDCTSTDNLNGSLRLIDGYATGNRTDLFFNWQINTDGGNNFIGSGQLDGNGIPPDFFSDVHIRRAFSYCFNYDTYLTEALDGDGYRSISVMLPGMAGYSGNTPYYAYDPAKCAEEFQASTLTSPDGRGVWDTGFLMKIGYNTGNTNRQVIGEILQRELAAVNDKFLVQVVGLTWDDYYSNYRAKRLPMFATGWILDIYDSYNLVVPYTTGAFGPRQNMDQDVMDQFRNINTSGSLAISWEEQNNTYTEFNQLYFDEAPAILLFQEEGRHYEQRWVKGWYFNPIYSGQYFYPLSKE